MKINQIIFDLDGTLIDSSESILSAFKGAFEKTGIKLTHPLTANIIGPPLHQALQLLSGLKDSTELDRLSTAFKDHYDSEGYRNTVVFPDVLNMLTAFTNMKIPLYIATNKRLKPTLLILEHLEWAHYFSEIYALDSLTPPAKDKTALLGYILKQHLFDPHTTYYIGDRTEDWDAAKKNEIPFAFASWGYDGNSQKNHAIKAYNTPIELLTEFMSTPPA
jgi:phosphoglycolate phosphatase